MPDIAKQRFTLHQVCRLADVSRTQINQWISRGYFKPDEEFEHGKPRSYTYADAVRLRVFTDLMRIGLSQETAGRHVLHLHGYKDEPAVLVVHHGPSTLIPASGRGKPEKKPDSEHKYYNPIEEPIHGKIIRLSRLVDYISDPDVYVMAAINLTATENRVKVALEKILSAEAEKDDAGTRM